MDIEEIIYSIYRLPAGSMETLKSYITEHEYARGRILIKVNRIEESIFFIKTGIARAFATKGDKEITFWFGKEGDTLVSMSSFVEGKPGYEDIELLEDAQLYEIKSSDLQSLFIQDIHIANWGRKFAETELMKAERRLISLQFGTATERYKELLENNPSLIQRVPLGHIASYLGITQVSLSRIRSEIK
ncbi:Crp/Fnr family transcriptional regulator [Chitinophaga rhizophila]|uniref:Crp/Fnr family transcriptional regulator n=1 Tax=Chitinophaga rhizophila TaxID=2866212 RepID=A0ABS7G7V3_9BACT|nr:Crp/Fnr family transcriptional regulator [Chitinophaga rhizophila]MBW8682874.1 Crp/Fnr family transcriptional regulator [Chitinophaga rhizophila]